MIEDGGAAAIYAGVLLAAALESEAVFVLAAVLASEGQLHPVGVAVAGATGAAIGDQACFFLMRGRLRSWLDRFDVVARHGRALAERVRRHQVAMVLAIRFAPGLRVALAAACAYAGVPPLRFVVLNGLSCVVWAGGLLALVAGAGTIPADGSGRPFPPWTLSLVVALVVILGAQAIARTLRRRLRADRQIPIERSPDR